MCYYLFDKGESMKKIIKNLKKATKIALFSHSNPDPDTIGSTLALYSALKQLGKEVDLFCDAEINENYSFLEDYKLYNSKLKENMDYDLYVAVDIASESMFTELADFFVAQENTIRLDHHISGSNYAKINYVKTESACAIVVYDLLKKMRFKITSKIATCLYFAICGDTGIFRNNNTDSTTFKVCSELLSQGAEIRKVYNEFFDKKTVPYIKLTSNILLNAKLNDKVKYAILKVTAKDYEDFGANENENVSNLPHSYLNAGYKVAVILKEREDGIHCSLRSKFEIDCSKIAEKFGGGGHKNAAGCLIEETIDKAEKLIEKEIKNYLEG